MAGTQVEARQFRSPVRKLVRFFERSRDNWKRKCKAAKYKCKVLGNQVRAVEKSRGRWREKAEAAQQRVAELERQLAEQKNHCGSGC